MKFAFTGFVFFLVGLVSNQVYAHGEDKLGPHGGFIRMPGAFHTEVVASAKNQLKIYLLDINWKNPTTKNSEVSVTLDDTKRKSSLKCDKSRDHFQCQLPNGTNLTTGKLEVQATREGQKGNSALYELPLQVLKPEKAHSEHQHH